MMLNDSNEGIKYAMDVVSKDILTNKWVRLACERFLADMDNDGAPWYYDKAAAQRVCDFYEHAIRHVAGPLAGHPYKMSGWEIFAIINVFGFIRKDNGMRRFRNWLQFVARKNSKSTLSSGAVLYHLLADGEEGAQAVSVATQRDQARICWDAADRMIQKMPTDARQYFKKTVSAISVPEMFNTYKPLGRDSKGLDGLNVSLALFDEAAAISDRNMFEVITSSQGSREQYLNIYITTAQFSKETYFYESYEYCKRILSGEIDDDTWFAAIYELDEGDDWKDESVWIKSNPNLGKSVGVEYLRSQSNLALEIPSQRNNLLVKHMNVWSSSSAAWLPTEEWSKSENHGINTGGELWVGIDLGATSDLTALGFLYRNGDKYHYDYRCFIPESALELAPKYVRPIYASAIEAGTLVLTPGNATDYDIVEDYLLEYTRDKDLKEIAYDPWSAQKFATSLLEQGAPLVEVNQGMRHLSPATKDTEIHIRKGEILHLQDRFLQWQFDNCSLYTDVNGNIKVRKSEDPNLKIDAIIALILAVSRASANGGLEDNDFGFTYIPS